MEEKKILRSFIQKQRDNLPKEFRNKASKAISNSFFKTKEYKQAKSIFIFYPFRSEINTKFIIKKALNDGKKIILPKIAGKSLKLFYINNLKNQLKLGPYNIMEPNEEFCTQADIDEIELAVIPGVCFDKSLNRLGYGGGFYDKLIPNLPKNVKKIALCFELQLVEKIPTEPHDSKVDKIITEKNVYPNLN